MINNQYNRAVSAQTQQLLNSQQNVFITENNSLMQNPHQLSEAFYFPQHGQLNLSAINQLPSQYQNSHSLMTSMNSLHQPSENTGAATIYDPRLTHVYATANVGQTARSTNANLIENSLNSVAPSQSSTILIDNYAAQLQSDQSQQIYRNSNPVSQSFSSTLQLPHSAMGRQAQRAPELMQHSQNYNHNDVAATTSSSQLLQLHHLPSTSQPMFLSADTFGNTPSGKMSAYLPFKVNSSFSAGMSEIFPRPLQASTNAAVGNATSPVVLDRINICINNHYADPNFSSPTVDTLTASTNAAADTPSLSSPIIPPIQHSAVIDPGLLIEPALNSNDANNVASIPSTVNEPDSTTTSHTPPSTPDNAVNLIASVNAIQSPSTSSTAKIDESFKDYITSIAKPNCEAASSCQQNETPLLPSEHFNANSEGDKEIVVDLTENTLPTQIVDLVAETLFSVGDDVFVKVDDDQLYLGTIIDSKYQRFRVRFDDASEMWCSPKEMRKFGAACDESNTSSGTGGEKGPDDSDSGVLCVACKRRDLIDVEICERCGRGYHKTCTTETSPGSGEWICKRCAKSMKLDPLENSCYEYENCSTLTEQAQQLPYDMQSLHWDSKHRVNDEQIYCYCGRTGQFDYNMLQCCKCLNWYHTSCMQNFKSSLLRGDGFYIFCCSICANGNEFLRRLQIESVDFIHLVLYNLSTKKKHQHHKYHHLTKDIWPFVLAQRQTSALPEEWSNLEENDLKDCILSTLKKNVERFVCGRELKRDYYFYGLRNNGPPPSPLEMPEVRQAISQAVEINDKFIVDCLKLRLSKHATENIEFGDATRAQSVLLEINLLSDKDDTDGKFTSEDEIPIKLILEKEKVRNNEKHENQQNALTENHRENEKKSTKKTETIKNHKRKAFTLSRLYKEPATMTDKQQRKNAANSESSSDENSSSSRGTSLDLIIPPPKDFLGANNPFRTVSTLNKNTSEKKTISFGRCISGGPAIRNSVVNATALDFSTNLAALKNAGVLPNLNTTNFARAAGQPRMVRTIKRRLSAKDIMIGPNQEIRRRRTRRLSSNVEVISTTTINPISSFFPINNASSSTKTAPPTTLRKHNFPSSSSASTSMQQLSAMKTEMQAATDSKPSAMHGRRLRLRPQNSQPTNSRRSSLSGASTSSQSSSSGNATPQTSAQQYSESTILSDLQQTVNKYFGVSHLIASGEQFSIHAKRQLPNGQTQLLIEWGVNDENSVNADSTTRTETGEKKISQDSS